MGEVDAVVGVLARDRRLPAAGSRGRDGLEKGCLIAVVAGYKFLNWHKPDKVGISGSMCAAWDAQLGG